MKRKRQINIRVFIEKNYLIWPSHQIPDSPNSPLKSIVICSSRDSYSFFRGIYKVWFLSSRSQLKAPTLFRSTLLKSQSLCFLVQNVDSQGIPKIAHVFGLPWFANSILSVATRFILYAKVLIGYFFLVEKV